MTDGVLIVGAGPTGLVLALWLAKQGVKVRIVDKSSGPGETSRAMAVQARTLELYRQLGLAEIVARAGVRNSSMNLWAGGKRKAHLALGDAGAGITPYPFILTYPQDQHERVLIARLEELGVCVERRTELLDFEDDGAEVIAHLEGPDGSMLSYRAQFLAGCDGARSPVRHQIGGGFEGGTYRQLFYVADVEVSGLEPADEAHIALDTSDFVAMLSYAHAGCRFIGTVQGERAEHPEALTLDDVSHAALRGLHVKIEKVNWFSTYNVHHRVTDHFRRGRVFLLGDAAHVHSPAGGQGMNTGIADAVNLAWKLAAVIQRKAPDALLDSFETERRAIAQKLVDTTDRVFTFVTAKGDFANFVRTSIAPLLARVAYRFDAPRELLFRLLSQTGVNYRGSALSKCAAGRVRGGDRLPWVCAGGGDNYEPLSSLAWQVHVYGAAKVELEDWCRQHDLALHVFAWRHEHQEAGLAQDAAYLMRPDTYVALADPAGSAAALQTYRTERGIVF